MTHNTRFDAALKQLQPHLPVYLLVPAAVVDVFNQRQTFTVEATANGEPLGRRSISRDGEKWFMVLTKQHMARLDAAVGDTLSFELKPTAQVPPELQGQIDTAGLNNVWNALTNADRRSFAEFVFEAKRPATRDARIARTLEKLRSKI